MSELIEALRKADRERQKRIVLEMKISRLESELLLKTWELESLKQQRAGVSGKPPRSILTTQ